MRKIIYLVESSIGTDNVILQKIITEILKIISETVGYVFVFGNIEFSIEDIRKFVRCPSICKVTAASRRELHDFHD